MKVGQMVMLISCDNFMPPLGACGEIVGALDSCGDHEVLFPHFLCPVPPGVTWEIPEVWLMPLNDGIFRDEITTSKELEAV